MCHKLGFYLQKLYKIDLMRIRVDFYQDEFKKIWLMQTDKIFIRERRKVPIEGKNLLADYILRQMKDLQEQEKEIERKKAEVEEQIRQSQIDALN